VTPLAPEKPRTVRGGAIRPARRPPPRTGAAERRRRLLTRLAPLAAVLAGAFVAGLVVGAEAGSSPAERFAEAWERADYAGMHAELTPAAAAEYPVERFSAVYEQARTTATIERVLAEEPDFDGASRALVPLSVDTVAFGDVDGELTLPLADDRVEWAPHLVFPGLAPGDRLDRRTEAPERAPILTEDGTPLAEGDAGDRSSPLGDAGADAAGELDRPEGEEKRALSARGFPADAPTGASGLELAFDERLAGTPGGELLAVTAGGGDRRTLASSEPEPGEPLETTIDPDLQSAAVAALAGRQGGVAVLDARDGSVRALAGSAYSAPQPPGSTFKVVTTTAALDSEAVEVSDKFPIRVSLEIDGRRIKNAEAPCGGSLEESFAHSCNSVFAPLGVEIGAEPLVAAAEGYGFNAAPTLFEEEATAKLDPPPPAMPTTFESERGLALAAIGEGAVRTTPLQLASMAQTVAAGGTRSPTPIVTEEELLPAAGPVEVTSKETARSLRGFMTTVVTEGTAASAGLAPGEVAGKTGTAELKEGPLREAGIEVVPSVEKPLNAWFLAFAPVEKPQLAVAVMVLDAGGDGGSVAAPIARDVLAAGLE
jgi:hypothetical protein